MMERENAWKKYQTKEEREKVFAFANQYRDFLSKCKTERECTSFFTDRAREAGFISLEELLETKRRLLPGDKVYAVNKGKGIALFVMGTTDIEQGMNILGAHIDSPRLDLKQNPLYEDTDLALLDTHYYGGVKKYQWVALPLALHGVIVKKDGTVVPVSVGERPEDPVFGVSDLLIHLAADQMEKKAAKVIEGEDLDILTGSMPLYDENDQEKKEMVKKNVLRILREQYDIGEEDFLSAEIEVVPAGEARDYGLDRSMLMGMGMMTGYVHIRRLWRCCRTLLQSGRWRVFWWIRRRSGVWVLPECSHASLKIRWRNW